MKKVLSALLLAVLLVSVTACGKAEEKKYDYDLNEYVTIGQFKGIEVPSSEIATTNEEAIDTIYAFLVENKAVSKVPVKDRPVQEGDFVNIDYEGLRDGVAFAGGTAKGTELEIGSQTFIEGFEEGLIGAEEGETVALNISFPESYPPNPDLAGVPVVFNVKINSIQAYSYPEIDKKFLEENFSDYDTPEEFIEDIRISCVDDKKLNYVQDKLFESATVIKYPEKEIAEFENELRDIYQQYADSYGVKLEEFVENYVGMDYATYEKEVKEFAQTSVKTQMVCLAIARNEGIVLSDEEFNSYAEEYAVDYGYESAAVCIDQMGRENITVQGLMDKVITIAFENSVVIEK